MSLTVPVVRQVVERDDGCWREREKKLPIDDNEVLFQRIVQCLVRTGEWDRLKAKLNDSLLDESGWSQIQQNGRDLLDMPSIQDLCDRRFTDAHNNTSLGLHPKDVREKINTLL
ncbi:hypothetical protein BDZ89DRAFT_1079705 [Hymenopellis radicata]|nr:hypothetical protein BDZ89DRAFT_1079705 [Hymenopellis radicata]